MHPPSITSPASAPAPPPPALAALPLGIASRASHNMNISPSLPRRSLGLAYLPVAFLFLKWFIKPLVDESCEVTSPADGSSSGRIFFASCSHEREIERKRDVSSGGRSSC